MKIYRGDLSPEGKFGLIDKQSFVVLVVMVMLT